MKKGHRNLFHHAPRNNAAFAVFLSPRPVDDELVICHFGSWHDSPQYFLLFIWPLGEKQLPCSPDEVTSLEPLIRRRNQKEDLTHLMLVMLPVSEPSLHLSS